MSADVTISIAADATLLNQGLEKAATEIRKLADGAQVTGQNLKGSLDLATQAQKALRDQITLTLSKQRDANDAYRKAADAVKASNRVIRDIKSSYASLTAEQKKSVAEQEKFRQALQKEMENRKKLTTVLTSARVEQQRTREQLGAYRNAVGAVEVSVRNLRAEQQRLNASNQNLGSSFKSVTGFANQLAGVFGFGFGLYGVMRLFKGATDTIVEFDKQIRTLASVSGSTAKELETLSFLAIKIGASSKYGAAGVAELMTELSKMGFSVDEIRNMTDGIVKLSTAAGEDLSTSAETVGNIIRAMGYDVANTGQIVDVMALAFNKSALDLSRFRESMKYVSPLAKSVGFNIENVAAVLAKLSDAGISGSMAGTSLRNIFMSLADSSSDLSKKLGGSITDFDSFINAMEKLKNEGVSAGEMFGLIDTRAVTALNTIKDNSGSIRQLSIDMENANGAVDEMANIQMQAISYQTKLAKNAWEGFILAMDKGDGMLSNMVRNTFSGFANAMNDITRLMTLQSIEMETEIAMLKSLQAIMSATNNTVEERIQMVIKLQKQYPEMFANMDIEASKWGEIEQAIISAINQKEAYLGIQFGREDIDATNIALERMQKFYAGLDKSITRQYEMLKLSEGQYKAAIKQMEDFDRKGKTMDETLKGTTMTVNAFRVAFTIDKQIEAAKGKIEEMTNSLKWLQFVSLDAIDAVKMDEMASEVSRISDKVIADFKSQADAAIDSGQTLTQAYSGALDNVSNKYREQIAVLKEREIQQKIEFDRLSSITDKTKEQEQELNKTFVAYRKTGFQIASLQISMNKLQDAYDEALNSKQKELSETGALLRLEQQIAEARARISLDGIALEERLSQLKLYYANKIANATLTGEELEKTLTLNRLQREIEKQTIEANGIKQRMALEESAHKRKMDLMATEQEFAKLEVAGFGKTAAEQAIEREMALQYLAFQYEEELRVISLQREQKKLDDQWQIQKATYKQGTDEYVRLHAEYIAQKEHLDEKYRQESDAATLKSLVEKQVIEEKYHAVKLEALKAEQAIQKRNADWQRENATYEANRIHGILDALDLLGRRTHRLREQEKQNNIEVLEEEKKRTQELKDRLVLRLAELKAMRDTATAAEIPIIDKQIEALEKGIEGADFDISKIDTLLQRILAPDMDMSEWQELISAMSGVKDQLVGIYQGILDERLRIASEERSMLDRRISEMQKDLDLELRLNEQGFASNVQNLMKAIEQEKIARDKALAEEKKAAEEKRRLEKVIQTINLLTAVSNVIKAESKLGLPGILTAAAGMAGLWMLWGNSMSKAKNTTYEKGGNFILNGKSHAQGGQMLAPGHEAQGGEMVSVFSRGATQKYGSEIKSMTDMFNKGKFDGDSAGNTFNFDTKDIKAIRKLLEDKESVTYSNGYKIIKRGNTTIRCRLN